MGPPSIFFLGWALPIYINRHPQPPAKYIRFYEISKSLYTCIVKINNLTGCRELGYSGIMNIKEIKKGDKILHSHMGSNPPVSGIVKESPIVGRGIRSTLLVDVKGSEVGLFDEIGSIYTKEILKVFRDDNWLPVEHV